MFGIVKLKPYIVGKQLNKGEQMEQMEQKIADLEAQLKVVPILDCTCDCGEDVGDIWHYCPNCGAKLSWGR